jgi:hypothetical protein
VIGTLRRRQATRPMFSDDAGQHRIAAQQETAGSAVVCGSHRAPHHIAYE